MFISKFGSGKNVYVRLMEAYRDKDGKPRSRVIKNFGRYDQLGEEQYQQLCAKYRQQGQDKKNATQMARQSELQRLLTSGVDSADPTRPLPLLNYGHYVLKQLWEQDLALDRKIHYLQKTQTRAHYDINAALSYLTFMKVLDPASVLYRYDDKDNLIGAPAEELALHDLYGTLDFAKEAKDDLMAWVNRQMDKQFGKPRANLVFYDVTNAYFESPLTDAEQGLEQSDFVENLYEMALEARDRGELLSECFDEHGCLVAERLPESFVEAVADEKIQYLKMRGPSKEHRFDLPIVSVALVVDSLGFPMDFAVYAGNDSELKSMRKSIESFKEKYAIEDVTVSADRGINSAVNLKMLQEAGLGFLVAQKVTQFDKKLTERMLHRELYTPIDPEHPEVGGYQIIENWEKKAKGKNDKVNCTLVLTYNEKRRQRDRAILEVWKSIVERKMTKGEKLGPRKTGWAALADIGEDQDKPILGINQEVYESRLKLCGYAALVYAPPQPNEKKKLPVHRLQPSELASAYKRQFSIEECFRILKSNIGLRPMYVWNSNHVRGHVTICVLALLLLQLLQHKLHQNHVDMSTGEICSALAGASVAAIKTKSASGQSDLMFFSCERRASLRKGREQMATEELFNQVKQGTLKVHGIKDVLGTVGLEPLPRLCSRPELARCLKTRFPQPTDAVSRLIFETM